MAKFEYAYHLQDDRNTGPAIHPFPVAASQTLKAGDLVFLSSGQVTVAGDTQASVLGVMAEDVTTPAAGTMVRVQVIAPGQVWRATADANATSHVLAAKKYDINATTQTVDVGDASGGCILILKLGDSTTDVYIMFTEFDLGCVN
jgi:hypothetical protein